MISYEEYLRRSAVPREVIDVFLDSAMLPWAKFDPELGYVLANSMPRDGLDGCATISTAQSNGARTAHVYAGRQCRINTYGDSFTQCHQVSDAETWQEYLAAHLGEPIRNFGMGGYGLYQAYRRLIRTEQTADGVEYVILYIWGDDHSRSALRCRHAISYPWWDHRGGTLFHGNFWSNLEMNMATGCLVERPNLLPTPDSLYKMTDSAFMVEALQDDSMAQLYVADRVEPSSLDLAALSGLAEILGVPGLDTGSTGNLRASALHLRNAYGFAATKHILEMAAEFCRTRGKKLMILLLCPTATKQLLRGEPRYDQEIVGYLREREFRYFDMNLVHLRDYQSFSLSIDDYLRRYYIGHYSPAGNHFFAFSIKNAIVEWLDPKPITYRTDDRQPADFRGYLPPDAVSPIQDTRG